MENSLLTVFLNVQPILLQNNLPFDQTNREFHLLLIFKNKPLNFVLSFIKRAICVKFENTLKNWHIKKNKKKRNFKRFYLKSLSEFRVKTNIFKNFIQFSSKKKRFFARFTHVGTRQGALPSTTPGAAASSSRGQKVKFLICVHCNICFNFLLPFVNLLENEARLTVSSVEMITF